MQLYCCECITKVDAILIDGSVAYPHRNDLHSLPFWQCPTCKNFVGCHYKTKDKTRPLGCIPNNEIKNARQHLHKLIDPIWQRGKMSRKYLYQRISDHIGRQYHTAEIRTINEARDIYAFVKQLEDK